jgi:hypothetical protein
MRAVWSRSTSSFVSRSGLRGWRLGVAGVNAVSRATLNMRPWAVIVKHLNHKILRFYFRSDARYREYRKISAASPYFRTISGRAVDVQQVTAARRENDGAMSRCDDRATAA